MSGRWPFVAEKIASRLDLIAPLVHRRRWPLPPFRLLPLPGAIIDAPICSDPAGWEEIAPQSYWGHADLNFVMKSQFEVPEGWDAERLALHLPLGVMGDIFNHPEALVHVDQTPIGSADRYHHSLTLSPDLADGAGHVLSLHGWTGLASWPPDPASKAKLFMGSPALVERHPELLAFRQLAETALDSARVLGAKSDAARALLDALDRAFLTLDTRDPMGEALYTSAGPALEALQEAIAQAGAPLDVTLHGIGHAHMDIAYLWPVDQIRLKNARTYANVLRLMDEDPGYRFSHSQPQLYAMVEQDYPQIFARIRDRVAEGRWEIMGGMWVEPDLNIPGPEALVRQLTLGRQYFHDRFGAVETPVLWLPDTFGFPAQIPQLMKLAGLRWFVTNKLNWNQLNAVPSSTHHWEGLDGSRVLAHVLTTPRDVQYLPFPTNYKSDLSAREVLGTWQRSTAPDNLRELPICYGYGDGGGGPTEDLLAKARAFAAMPGMPRLRPSTLRALFERLEAEDPDLPVWQGEHYMEGHRGVLTSQGWIKRANRKAEWALHEAEAICAMAGLAPDLRPIWQRLCLNQFHDILTGTSVTQVFDDARADFATIARETEEVAAAAAAELALSERAVVNTSPVTGPRLALVTGDVPDGAQVVDGGALVCFDALPGYSVTPLSRAARPEGGARALVEGDGFALENAHVLVTLNDAGQLTRVYDKLTGRDALAPGALGNQLLAFEDRPICWDAWDIDPFIEDRRETLAGVTTCRITETGPLRTSIEITTRWRRSTIRQTLRLRAHSPRLDFETDVDWHETHTLLKAAFPTGIHAPEAMFDIQWGRISRATSRDTDFDAARFEVPAQKWAQLSDGRRWAAVLNDCKYGYDVFGDTIRITLIKCATSPDPVADQGRHVFTYAYLVGAASDTQPLLTESYDLNAPLRVLAPRAAASGKAGAFVTCDAATVVVETLKPAEDRRGVVLRLFETQGQAADASLRFAQEIRTVEVTDLMEVPQETRDPDGSAVKVRLAPYQILTLRVRFAET